MHSCIKHFNLLPKCKQVVRPCLWTSTGAGGIGAATTSSASNCFSFNRLLHISSCSRYNEYDTKTHYDPGEHPVERTIECFRADFQRMRRRYNTARNDYYGRFGLLEHPYRDPQQHEYIVADPAVLIIGGGLVGSSVAWWLKQRCRDEDMTVTVVEGDHTFSKCSTVLSTGGIRQQFSIPENVEMSLFTAEFLRNAGEHFRILDNEPPDINFTPMGYLFLATTQESAQKLEARWKIQTDLGAKVRLMNAEDLRAKYPFMNFDDVVLGSLGLENEGIIDPWQLLSAIREKNLTLGVQYVKARLTGFQFRFFDGFDPHGLYPESDHWRFKDLEAAIIEPQMTDSSPRKIRAHMYVNAAGAWAGDVARMAGIGSGSGLMSVPIPIVPRKRCVYIVHVPDGPGLDMPFFIDPSGVWCRRDGLCNLYLCGKSPSKEEDEMIDHDNLDVDYDYFDQKIWPVLAARIPAFENLKVKNAWAGWYDHNMFDQNPIIGPHFHYQNFYMCAGFSGHGFQHAITAGRGLMQKIYDGAYMHINYKKFGFERLYENKPLLEDLII